jgi:hypothetical protein
VGARIKAPCYPAPPRPPGMVASDVSYRYVSRATSHAQLTRQLAVMLSLSLWPAPPGLVAASAPTHEMFAQRHGRVVMSFTCLAVRYG